MEFIENYCGFSIFKDSFNRYVAKCKTETFIEKSLHDICAAITLYNLRRPA